jgi:hypothetical protein
VENACKERIVRVKNAQQTTASGNSPQCKFLVHPNLAKLTSPQPLVNKIELMLTLTDNKQWEGI